LYIQQRQKQDYLLRRRTERKVEDVLNDQFGFRRRKGTREAIWVLRIISQQTVEIDKELRACFIDWQKGFDCGKYTTLMHTD
jgi:hypothetical protein